MAHAFMAAELEDQKRGYKLNAGTRIAEQVEQAKRNLAAVQIESAAFISNIVPSINIRTNRLLVNFFTFSVLLCYL